MVNTFLTPEANLYFRCLKEELAEASQLNRSSLPFEVILTNAAGSGQIELSTHNDTEITPTHTHKNTHTHTPTHTIEKSVS